MHHTHHTHHTHHLQAEHTDGKQLSQMRPSQSQKGMKRKRQKQRRQKQRRQAGPATATTAAAALVARSSAISSSTKARIAAGWATAAAAMTTEAWPLRSTACSPRSRAPCTERGVDGRAFLWTSKTHCRYCVEYRTHVSSTRCFW